MTDVHPPRWAESMLPLVLEAGAGESIAGDLLEAYRDAVLPERGRAAADVWYVRQVAGFFGRVIGPWVLLLAVTAIVHDYLNTFHGGAYQGGPLTRTFSALHVAELFAVGAYAGSRTRRIAAGALLTLAAHWLRVLLVVLWWIADWPWAIAAMKVSPYWIDAWHYSGAAGETFEHWLFWDNVGALVFGGGMTTALALVLGLAGGAAGAFFRPSTRRRAGAS
jgi:hypothetical protein